MPCSQQGLPHTLLRLLVIPCTSIGMQDTAQSTAYWVTLPSRRLCGSFTSELSSCFLELIFEEVNGCNYIQGAVQARGRKWELGETYSGIPCGMRAITSFLRRAIELRRSVLARSRANIPDFYCETCLNSLCVQRGILIRLSCVHYISTRHYFVLRTMVQFLLKKSSALSSSRAGLAWIPGPPVEARRCLVWNLGMRVSNLKPQHDPLLIAHYEVLHMSNELNVPTGEC